MNQEKFGLSISTIKKINGVFLTYPQIEEVIIYGSRAKDTYKHGSDIDLTMKGNNLDLTILNKVTNDMDDLMLPYTMDISIYSHIDNNELLDHIARVGKIFYKK